MNEPACISQFKQFYNALSDAEWATMDRFYAPHIRFRDPVHKVDGLPALHKYIAGLCENVTSCRFDYLDELITGCRAYIKWDMVYAHPRLNDGAPLTVRGISQLEFCEEKGIYYHEDVYDMGAMVYEHVPVIGLGVRWLKYRLEQQ